MSSTVYVSPSVTAWAKAVQREHDAAEGGWWCKACYRRLLGKIRAGRCERYLEAEQVLTAHRARPRNRPAAGRSFFRD